MKSSIIIALGTTAISTISGVLAAWAFERFTFKLVERRNASLHRYHKGDKSLAARPPGRGRSRAGV